MQRGIAYSHEEICNLIREEVANTNENKIEEDFLRVSISFYRNEATAIVTHCDGVSHLWETKK